MREMRERDGRGVHEEQGVLRKGWYERTCKRPSATAAAASKSKSTSTTYTCTSQGPSIFFSDTSVTWWGWWGSSDCWDSVSSLLPPSPWPDLIGEPFLTLPLRCCCSSVLPLALPFLSSPAPPFTLPLRCKGSGRSSLIEASGV